MALGSCFIFFFKHTYGQGLLARDDASNSERTSYLDFEDALSLPIEHLFWIRFHQSAKRLSFVLCTSARPLLCASILVFFSIFELIVFSMLNENLYVK